MIDRSFVSGIGFHGRGEKDVASPERSSVQRFRFSFSVIIWLTETSCARMFDWMVDLSNGNILVVFSRPAFNQNAWTSERERGRASESESEWCCRSVRSMLSVLLNNARQNQARTKKEDASASSSSQQQQHFTTPNILHFSSRFFLDSQLQWLKNAKRPFLKSLPMTFQSRWVNY